MEENPAQESTEKKKKNTSTIGCLACIIIFAVFGFMFSRSPTDKPVTTEPASQTSAASLTEAQKAEILEFEKQVFATEKIATNAIEIYTTKMSDMGNGKATIYEVYSAASKAKDKCKETQFAMSKVKTPQTTKEINKLLDDTKSEIGTAYMLKAEALDSVMKFLDDQKPSDMQNFKDKIKSADSFIMGAVMKLYQAKEKAGIDVAKNQ
ncbi:hypothetical protein [Pelotomaculum propionicicum]|uniref:Uncharacterized protein n=1 Tax=Pelotomaculum propionicicum TaxID=258475 RepID=A0A4Y7RWG7_9FIRM|nr:hypothetical protein [Pelotomaculum propionicicum]TEB13335.1 hypothetical protein Pmgp_00229 [Pelotomaculum propionicicum]